jgi:hypothetical protein
MRSGDNSQWAVVIRGSIQVYAKRENRDNAEAGAWA